MNVKQIVDQEKIFDILKRTRSVSRKKIGKIIENSRGLKGLTLEEVGILVNANDPEIIETMFKAAHYIKQAIYGNRLVFFAPLYLSNWCINDCEYCGFHIRNKLMTRKKLTLEEVVEETRVLIDMGHKRLLLECGEDPRHSPIDYVVRCIKTIYSVRSGKGNIRRVNVNIAATTAENYRKLKEAGIGTYQLFQETYHYETYKRLHRGPKADYVRQITAHDRAMEAQIDDLGLGVLFGLYDWRFEVLGLVSHAKYLDRKYNVGPHTFSVPRVCPAESVDLPLPYRVSDQDFLRIIAILRIAVPYTGMILSTRERLEIRKKAFEIGISQASAASIASPGGYTKKSKFDEASQFSLYDHRSLEEVVESLLFQDILPSFCTACYRTGRTGEKFMNLAKPGDIQNFCLPNALLTFAEYLEDYTEEGLKEVGWQVIGRYLDQIPKKSIERETRRRLERIKKGERDIYF